MKSNAEARKNPGMRAQAEFRISAQGQATQVKTFTWTRKLLADGSHFNHLLEFETPKDIEGIKVWLLEKQESRNEVFIYLPALGSIRKIQAASQGSKMMNSGFSYSDFVPASPSQFAHRSLRKEPCPGLEQTLCHVVESTPASDDLKARLGYSRLLQWVDEEHFVRVKVEYYGKDDTLQKTMTAGDLRPVDSRRWLAFRQQVVEALSGRVTEVIYKKITIDPAIPDGNFVPRVENAQSPALRAKNLE